MEAVVSTSHGQECARRGDLDKRRWAESLITAVTEDRLPRLKVTH